MREMVMMAPATAAAVGSVTPRMVVEIRDARYGAGELHFCRGDIGHDFTVSVDLGGTGDVVARCWRHGSTIDTMSHDRHEVLAALVADGILMRP